MSRLPVRSSLVGACLTLGVAAAAPAAGAAGSPSCPAVGPVTTCTFSATGAAQTFAVPSGVSTINADVLGAQGGSGGGQAFCSSGSFVAQPGGKGGQALGNSLPVTPGNLQVNVGGMGGSTTGLGGFNGGGAGFGQVADRVLGGGGGASDIRTSPFALANRVEVGGGGGGGGACSPGGAGGGPVGLDGGPFGASVPGGGGTGTLPGTSSLTQAGAPGLGGSGKLAGNGTDSGAGGGGGLFGGGGGSLQGAGGGGSGFLTAGVFAQSIHTGDGLVTIVFTPPKTFAALCALTQTEYGPANATFAFAQCQTLTQAAGAGFFRVLYVNQYKSELARAVRLHLVTQDQANQLLAFLATIP